MFKGTIVENSLADKSILDEVEIVKSWQDDDWFLHNVMVNEDQFSKLQESLVAGPWYMNFWIPNGDNMKIVYKDRIFNVSISEKSTWSDAISYGKSIGIPEEQLDFVVN